MIPAKQAGRGRPVRFLAVLALAWVGVRMVTWSSPIPAVLPEARIGSALVELASPPGAGDLVISAQTFETLPVRMARNPAPLPTRPVDQLPLSLPVAQSSPEVPLFARGRSAAAQNLIWAAGMRALPLPAAIAERFGRETASFQPSPARDGAEPAPSAASLGKAGPWHFDAWFLHRRDARVTPLGGTQAPALGGSQAGAMLAYSLSGEWPEARAILRIAGVPNSATGQSDAEIGAGVRVRPLASLPAILQVEGRIRRQAGRTQIAPAAFIAGGVDDRPLPLGMRLRAYGEAGWVGGDLPTVFAGGHVVAEREIAAFDLASLNIGAGAWGGAQRDAMRVDIGPSLSLRMAPDDRPIRLQIDYRVRVAGDANPVSGPAVTLSTGF